MKNILFSLCTLFCWTAAADVFLYLPVDGLKTPTTPAQIRLIGGDTEALHDLLPYDWQTNGTKLRIMTANGPLAVIGCIRKSLQAKSERDSDNYQCTIAFGQETSIHDFWPVEPLDMGGAYSGPSPIATVATLDPGSFPENGEIVFWGGRTSYLNANLPGPVTFQGPRWNLTLGCQADYQDPVTKNTRHDSICKLVLKKR